jgi:hypothetical protein
LINFNVTKRNVRGPIRKDAAANPEDQKLRQGQTTTDLINSDTVTNLSRLIPLDWMCRLRMKQRVPGPRWKPRTSCWDPMTLSA